MSAEYVRMPAKLQAQLLREIRRARVFSFVLYFPVLILFFTALEAGFLLWKGHALMWAAEKAVQGGMTERTLHLVVGSGLVVVAVAAVIFMLIQNYRECTPEEHLFCASCDAVDADDEGLCPVCGAVLGEFASFFYSSDADELKRLAKHGLTPSQKPRPMTIAPADDNKPPRRQLDEK
jgi:hypothetical protein